MNRYYVYIMASQKNGTLYTGVTRNLQNRVTQHKQEVSDSFTSKYNVNRLVYYCVFSDIRDAILAEKRIKTWKREWKLNLIEKGNPNWEDLAISGDFVHV